MFGFFNNDDINKHSGIINEKLSDNNNPPILEDLLIEEDIIDELQNKNEKLINYFNKQKIKQMLDYIIKEPKVEEDHNKSYKFPFVCSKLFNVEETKIMNYFLKTNKELIKESDENKKNLKNEEIFEKTGKNEKNPKKDLYFDLFQDDDINEPKYDDANDKEIEININDINNKKNEDDNNDDNCNYKDDNNENDDIDKNEVINKDNKNNNDNNNDNNDINDNNDNIVNQNNENNDIEEKIIIKEEALLNKKNKNICLFKSRDITIDNSTQNQRYEMPKLKKQNINNEEEINDKYPENKIEILDYFFSFLMTDSELNYVLCGYFSSLMLNLLNINSSIIIKYLFLQRKDILKRLVYHSYRKSIAEILCKVIKYEEIFNDKNIYEENKNNYDEKEFSLIRLEIISDIFSKIDINMDTEKLYSLSFIINDLAENKNIFESILNNKNIIHSLINNQLKDINFNLNNIKNNFIIIIDIIINWLNNINKIDIQIPMLLYEVDDDLEDEDDLVQQKENENSQPEVHHTLLSRALFDVLPNLIKNNFNRVEKDKNNENSNDNDYILQSYNDYKLKPLGLYKIKIVDILTSLISYCKNIPNEYDNLLIDSNFIENAINYIFEYEWNNCYQEAIFQFFKKLLIYDKDYPYHEILAEYLFTKVNILNKIISNLKNINNNENEGNIGKGYTALLISLSYKINTIIGGNYIDLNNSYTREGSITFMNRGENTNNKVMDIFYGKNKNNEKNNKEEKDEIKPINCMKKYCNEEWNDFFRDHISNKIKLYEGKLYDQKNNLDDSRDDALFCNDFEHDNNNDNETEDLLGKYKSRDEELFEDNNKYDDNEDLVNNDINDINDKDDKYDKYDIHKKEKDMAKFKDMEININDFNFIEDNEEKKIDIKKNYNANDNDNDNQNRDLNEIKNENENVLDDKENEDKIEIENKYNSVNYWKNSLEKENNSYLNNLGEEALNDLLE